MQEVAYGILGLQPDQFWSMTLKQFQLAVNGFKHKDKNMWNKIAQHASWVTAPHLKRPISAKKLLGVQNKGTKVKTNPEKTKQMLDELERDFEERSTLRR